jgi:hypothetical protein
MLIKEIFKDIFKGLKLENNSITDSIKAYSFGVRDVENCIINYQRDGIIKVNMRVKDKYFLKEGDVVVAAMPSQSSSHVGYFSKTGDEDKVIINRNFIALRNPIEDYDPEFVAEYLENFGIPELKDKKNLEALTIDDIEKIDIPKVSKEEQNELMKLIHPINQRSRYYNRLIKNDIEIKKYMMREQKDHAKQD